MYTTNSFLILVQVFCLLFIFCEETSASCQTPRGKNGVCKSISECQPLLSLLQKQPREPEDVDYLRNSRCGSDGGLPKVCCPVEETSSRSVTPVEAPSSCGSPDKLINTTIVGDNYDVGSNIEYQCPEGHMLTGDGKRSCGTNGFWTGIAPTCKYVDCGDLPDLEHGTVTLEDRRTTHGAKAVYTCHENYTLIGHEMRMCGDDAKWTNSTPECLFDWCPDPPAIHGGIVSITGHRAGDTATYSCQPGYIIFGQGVTDDI